MNVLLGSGGMRTDERRALCCDEMRRHFGDIDRILFIPWAAVNHEAYVERMTEVGLHAGYTLEGIHTHADPVEAIEHAQGIYVGGGNTFLLTRELHRTGAIEPIRRRVFDDAVPYMGVSAGSNVACPTMQTTNDMPVVFPGSFEALNLVPFQVNAHYYGGSIWVKAGEEFTEHFGETRKDRIREFHQHNTQPVVGLCEGGFLRCTTTEVHLVGGEATIFNADKAPVVMPPDTELSGALLGYCG
jgi:dipeptidase E